VELYLHSPNTPSWGGAQLKHRDNFTCTFYLKTLRLLSFILVLIVEFVLPVFICSVICFGAATPEQNKEIIQNRTAVSHFPRGCSCGQTQHVFRYSLTCMFSSIQVGADVRGKFKCASSSVEMCIILTLTVKHSIQIS